MSTALENGGPAEGGEADELRLSPEQIHAHLVQRLNKALGETDDPSELAKLSSELRHLLFHP